MSRLFIKLFLVVFVSLSATHVTHAAPIETYTFDSPEHEETFYKLNDELRCLVCQNQNIAESNADLAKDLRKQIYTMLSDGQSEQQIVDFMVERYGDYVLYRPPMKPLTWLLWFGPALIFFVGLVLAFKKLRSHSVQTPQKDLTQEERDRINRLHSEQK